MYLLIAFFALALPVITFTIVYARFLNRVRNKPCNGPDGVPIFGTMIDSLNNRDRYLDYAMELRKEYGTAIYLYNPFTQGILLLNPEDIKHVLYTNFKNFTRQGMNKNRYWFKWLGSGIFNAWGDNWREQRKTARPLFHKLVVQDMMPQFRENAHIVIDILQSHMNSGEPIDIQDLFFRYTLDTFGKLGFGEDLGSLKSKPEFATCFDKTQEIVVSSFRNPILSYTSALKEFDTCIETIEKAVYGFISKRRQLQREELLKRKDLLSRFMCLRDDNGEPYSDKYLRDIFMNFLIAGRDTTAVLMSWFTYLVSTHESSLQNVLKEIDQTFPDLQEPRESEYQHMRVLHNTIQETLRLYPSVPFNGRFTIEDDVLPSGITIRAGMRARISMYLTHRDPDLWNEPNVFKPERWDDPHLLKHPYQFVPFHAGPQICLGKGLALTEAKTLLIMLLQRFTFSLAPDHVVKPKPKVILVSSTGMKMNVRGRVN